MVHRSSVHPFTHFYEGFPSFIPYSLSLRRCLRKTELGDGYMCEQKTAETRTQMADGTYRRPTPRGRPGLCRRGQGLRRSPAWRTHVVQESQTRPRLCAASSGRANASVVLESPNPSSAEAAATHSPDSEQRHKIRCKLGGFLNHLCSHHKHASIFLAFWAIFQSCWHPEFEFSPSSFN